MRGRPACGRLCGQPHTLHGQPHTPCPRRCCAPQAIKLILIYGILGLEQQFPAGAPSLPELQRLVSRGGANLVVERNLPALQRQVLTLQSQLDDVYDKLALEVRWTGVARRRAHTGQLRQRKR